MHDETTLTTIIGVSNLSVPDPREVPQCQVMSYIAPTEDIAPSHPLSEGAVRVGDSLLNARVPEAAIQRDASEDF
jgi:hypothetical protein